MILDHFILNILIFKVSSQDDLFHVQHLPSDGLGLGDKEEGHNVDTAEVYINQEQDYEDQLKEWQNVETVGAYPIPDTKDLESPSQTSFVEPSQLTKVRSLPNYIKDQYLNKLFEKTCIY